MLFRTLKVVCGLRGAVGGRKKSPREDGFSFPRIAWFQTGLFIFDITDHQTWKAVGVCSDSLR